MSEVYYSAARRGFFHAATHPTLPEDAVRISRLRHRQLLDAQAQGRTIVANHKGRPVLAPIVPPSLEQLRARANAPSMPRQAGASSLSPRSSARPTTTR